MQLCVRNHAFVERGPERWKGFRQHVEPMFRGPLSSKKEGRKKQLSAHMVWRERARYREHIIKYQRERQEKTQDLLRPI